MAENEVLVSSTSSKTDKKKRERLISRSSTSSFDSQNSFSIFTDRDGSSSAREGTSGSGRLSLDSQLHVNKKQTRLFDRKEESESPSPTLSQTNFPYNTSYWTDDHLNSLGISVKLSSVLTLDNIINTVFKEADLEPDNARRFKQFILNHPSRGWKSLRKYTCITDIFQTNLETLRSELTSVDFLPGLQWAVDSMEISDAFFTHRLHVTGEMFGRYLVYLAELHQSGEIISEMMYQTLFQYFLQMFGLYCNTAPAIPAKHMKIIDDNVTSVPNILLSNSQKIIALVKVKQDYDIYEDEEQPPRKMPRLPSQKQDQKPTRHIFHLDSKLIGQTGGDLLVHLKSSKGKENRILGIIVQQTHVTFTYLQCKENVDIENGIKEDSRFLEENHIMEFSKPYDYLDSEMREQIMEHFIALGFMQNRS